MGRFRRPQHERQQYHWQRAAEGSEMATWALYEKETGVIRNISHGEKPDMTYHHGMACHELAEQLPGQIISDHVVVEGQVQPRKFDFGEAKHRKALLAAQHH